MTRLGQLRSQRQLDLAGAFRFLAMGQGPARRNLAFAIELLRESGVEEVVYDDDLVELAEANGASAFDALDLATAFAHGVEGLTGGPKRSRE